ncbi:MAG TPA: DUF2125 domain-containing protein [Caulobacteraceae bacterium]|nr:DUF2125 domain-containing protein [Caulobacteraceae bacterium]
MSHTDRQRPGKPRRLWLFLPYVLALVVAAGWCVAWFAIKAEAERRMDEARADMARAGYALDWDGRRIDGFPFRLDAHFTGLRLAEPSGWAVTAPKVDAEAWAYAPTHWIFVAPQGMTLVRPKGGPVAIGARALRASVSQFDDHPPRISVEALDVTFAPPPGAAPYWVNSAKELHLHLKAGPADQGAIYVELDQARARLSGLLARIVDDRPVTLVADAIFSHASEISGRDWPSAMRRWSASGGQFQVRQLRLAAGQSLLDADTGVLTVDPDGRLHGTLHAGLRQAPPALAAASAASAVLSGRPDDAARVTLDFRDGQTTLGPVSIGPAPKLF